MADSNITKRALAAALKELMEELPFEKINVRLICEKCDMNRKSFYYHFRDKYDLVNWIFDTEFIDVVMRKGYESAWALLEELTRYFYENRVFYRKALLFSGQNSFTEHFQEMLCPVIREQQRVLVIDSEAKEFQVNFLADAITVAIARWLTDKNRLPPEKFVALLQECAYSAVRYAAKHEPEPAAQEAAEQPAEQQRRDL